jgi:hypothetical protein
MAGSGRIEMLPIEPGLASGSEHSMALSLEAAAIWQQTRCVAAAAAAAAFQSLSQTTWSTT